MANPKSGKAISNMDFAKMHPMDVAVQPTDTYYTYIANKIYKILTPLTVKGHTHEFVRQMSLMIAAYFEDQVSELGIWRAFIEKNRELTGKWLPWYETTEDYFEDEVNPQDIQLIMWLKLTSAEDEKIYYPLDKEVKALAETVYALLLNEFEKAPINQKLYDMLYSDYFSSDYQNLKKLLSWMVSDCYLMVIPPIYIQQRKEMELHYKSMTRGIKTNKNLSKNAVDTYCSLNSNVGPLALHANQWYALMRQYKGLTWDNENILTVEGTPFYAFGVIEIDKDTVLLRSCRGVEYRVEKASFNYEQARSLEKNNIIVTTLSRYRDKWYVNDTLLMKGATDENDLTAKLNNSANSLHNELGMAIDFFGVVDPKAFAKVSEEQAKNRDAIIAENHESRLFYFPSMKDAFAWEEKKLGIKMPVTEQLERTPQFHKPSYLFITKEDFLLNMINPENIHDPNNPYYNEEDAKQDISYFINYLPSMAELSAYLVEHNCLDEARFEDVDGVDGHKLLQDNIKFLGTFVYQFSCYSK